jgi:antitoxin component HigA of HigAB toxin-antitoxin module
MKALEPRIIKTDEQYRRFLEEVERLAALDPDPDSSEGARLELLAMLVEMYERVRFAFARPDPIEAIAFRMEQQGYRSRASLRCSAARSGVRGAFQEAPAYSADDRSLYEKLKRRAVDPEPTATQYPGREPACANPGDAGSGVQNDPNRYR